MTGLAHAADAQQRDAVLKAYDNLREQLEAAQPDVLVCISNDHLTNFFLNNMPTFCVCVADSYFGPPPEFEQLVGVKPRTFPGHVDLGQAILKEALDSGFDPSFSGELVFDDNFAGPLQLLLPDKTLPLVLIQVNSVEHPMPKLQRCYDLGGVLGRAVEKSGLRVAFLATGGLSHSVGTARMGYIDTEFDKKFLDLLKQGKAEEVTKFTDEEVEAAGNGAYEIRNWLVMLGAVAGAKFDVLAYEPIHPWITGMAVAAARLES
jgi:protocatechuate 4,5-dioxygenase beta chain/2,3-dihydroxyphenylpropionate 1,2-dioxygenase